MGLGPCRVRVVVYAYRGEDIRLISARRAESRERKSVRCKDENLRFQRSRRGAVLPLLPGKERITIRLDVDISRIAEFSLTCWSEPHG